MRAYKIIPIALLSLLATVGSVFAGVITRDVGNIAIIEADNNILFFPQDAMMNNCSLQSVSMTQMAQKFYLTHSDVYQLLVMFTNFSVLLNPDANCNEQFRAFHQGASNAVTGIGRTIFDNSGNYGSAGVLESVLHMNDLTLSPLDPNQRISGNNDSVLSLLGQEAGHRWGAYVQFDSDPTAGVTASNNLLGRANQHWSYFKNAASATSSGADPEGSSLEGNFWQVNTPVAGQFQTATVTDGFSRLDLYLMGYLSAGSVGPFWYINNPFNVNPNRTATSSPSAGTVAQGTQTFVSVSDVITIEGARSPSSSSSPKIYRMAFILLTPQGIDVTQNEIDQIEVYRVAWERYFEEETLGLGASINDLDQVVFVDKANAGAEDGSRNNPWNTVTEARDNSVSGDSLIICAGSYPEILTISSRRFLRAAGGSAVIGG